MVNTSLNFRTNQAPRTIHKPDQIREIDRNNKLLYASMLKIANTHNLKLNDPKLDELHDKLANGHFNKRGKQLTKIEKENIAFLKRLENVKSDYKTVSPQRH